MPVKDPERVRLGRTFARCRCGNHAGLGQVLCSRCRERDAAIELRRETVRRLRNLQYAVRKGNTDALRDAVDYLLSVELDR